jgi:hypothetical protein
MRLTVLTYCIASFLLPASAFCALASGTASSTMGQLRTRLPSSPDSNGVQCPAKGSVHHSIHVVAAGAAFNEPLGESHLSDAFSDALVSALCCYSIGNWAYLAVRGAKNSLISRRPAGLSRALSMSGGSVTPPSSAAASSRTKFGLASAWGVLSVLAILGNAVKRLAPIALQPFKVHCMLLYQTHAVEG